jgi:hypothetical protein
MYNKLCNKQDRFFSSSRSYLDKGQGLPNEFKKTYKPFDLIKFCHTKSYNFMIDEIKILKNRRLNSMHNVEMIPLWLFP